MPGDLHFLRAEWLWVLPIVIAGAYLLAHRRIGPGQWRQVVAPTLAPYVLTRFAGDRWDPRWWLVGVGGVLAVIALAGPAWQRIEQPVFRSEQALVIALDLSRSMDATDVAPSRLARARLKILDILERRGSGQTALVVYSSNAFTVTPLTTDTDTIAALVNSLSTDIMPSRGSYPIAAIDKGRQLLAQAGASVGEILLITDGGTSPAAELRARELRATGYTLSILAIGTPDGAPIPRPGGGFVTDQAGRIAVPKLEERSLRALAAAGGGRFARMSTNDRDIEHLLSGAVGPQAAGDQTLATDLWREEGPWLVLLLLPVASLAFRRGWLFVAVVALLPATEPAQAGVWDDIWWTKDQQAARALERGDAETAAELFEDPDWRAVAEYRAGNYPASARGFAEQPDLRSLYNLGNALARQGELDSAIDAYEKVLEREPDHADAAYNRDLLAQLKAEQQSRQQGDQQEPSESEDGQGQQSESDNQGDPAESDSDSGSPGESGDQDTSERGNDETSDDDFEALREELERAAREADAAGEPAEQLTAAELEELRRQQEQQQAMEQWLRRIPNDPGGLLRRKFRYQYQKSGKDQDGNNTWPDDEVNPW